MGLPNAGKRTLFDDVSSAVPHKREVAGTHCEYRECVVQVGLDEATLIDVPSCPTPPQALLESADAIIQVVDSTALVAHLRLTRRLRGLGKPLVIALNRVDLAHERGLAVNVDGLRAMLGVPVVPTMALMGRGLRELFATAVTAVRDGSIPRAEQAEWPERGWRHAVDEMFLHPRWGIVGSIAVFTAVLFIVFEVSAWLDAATTAKLSEALAAWQPASTGGVILRAIADGLVGLVGIVVPYMIPLVLLLVTLEQSGVMQRIAFVVDRAFHRIGLHGGVAVPFLTGLGCNVPAIVTAAQVTRGRERLIASVLITFVPCSARSAIILAVAGKYLGGIGVLAIFALSIVLIALLGRLLSRDAKRLGPGQIPEIPELALPSWRQVVSTGWERSRDVVTIVMPLLVVGSIVLALLHHAGGDGFINAALAPLTLGWLGLPVALGVPLLFGVLRKELSLLMIFQALGTLEVGHVLDATQLMTLLAFLTLYVPCLSTFAVMVRTIGRRQAFFSLAISIGAALVAGGLVRFTMLGTSLLI
ncbi:MAG: nucleoside recognition domain-containing protein [Bacillota bacterium]